MATLVMHLRAASLVCLLALLAACVQVPDSGPVRAGPEVGSDDDPVLRYVPSGPQPGADPVAVINGYLDAMRAYPANPGIVREFLTDQARSRWSPSEGTLIYTDRPELEQVRRRLVRVETGLRARLSARGAWSTPDPGERSVSREFRLERQDGEWRIANPAPGLWIPEYDFDRYYEAYSLYFFDPAQRVLVPDPVYLPEGDQTATLLLRGLLRGPTDWLDGAVASMLPPTDRADVTVPVSEDGIAHIQLGVAAQGLGARERELLSAQLSWTMRQVPDVEAIRVTANGTTVPLGGGNDVTEVGGAPDYDPADSAASQAMFALRGERVVAVDVFEGRIRPLGGRFGGEVPVSAFAVDRSAQTVAAVTSDQTKVEVTPLGGSRVGVWLDGAQNLTAVQWDIHGLVWALDRTDSGPVLRVLREGETAPVALRDDPPDDMRAFALARDGLRIAAVAGRGPSSRLLLGRVRRPADGSLPLAVDHWREIDTGPSDLRDFVDVAWASPTELTVVAESTQDSPQTFTVSTDGSSVEPSALVDLDVVSVADAPVADLPAVLGTRPGTLFVQLSDRWSEVAVESALRSPAYVE